MLGRIYTSSDQDYKFGFNGMLEDDEVKGKGNSLDFGARIYDSRIARWLSVDPLQKKYPSLSPYSAFSNNPLYYSDPNGREIFGYLALLQVEKWGKAIEILNKNSVWINALTFHFSSMNSGDQLTTNPTNGKYANVPLRFTYSPTLGPAGSSSIGIFKADGSFVDNYNPETSSLIEGQRLGVQVSISTTSGLQNDLLTLPHEVILHSIDQAALIDKHNSGEISTNEFNSLYADLINCQDEENNLELGHKHETGVKGHIELGAASNELYESINDETESILSSVNIEVYGTGIGPNGNVEGHALKPGEMDKKGNKAKNFITSFSNRIKESRHAERFQYKSPIE